MKKILIACHHDDFENKYKQKWSTLLVRDCFQDRIIEAGYFPVILPSLPLPEKILSQLIDEVDGMVLYGGNDIDPACYGESVSYCTQRYLYRDQTELAATREAIQQKKPLFGICRGHQLINVALGGSLYQDIKAEIPGASLQHMTDGDNRELYAHKVTLTADSLLADIVGSDTIQVNSLHNQAIKTLWVWIKAAGVSEDGVIEAIEHESLPILGVQRHPEYSKHTHQESRRLFSWVLEKLFTLA